MTVVVLQPPIEKVKGELSFEGYVIRKLSLFQLLLSRSVGGEYFVHQLVPKDMIVLVLRFVFMLKGIENEEESDHPFHVCEDLHEGFLSHFKNVVDRHGAVDDIFVSRMIEKQTHLLINSVRHESQLDESLLQFFDCVFHEIVILEILVLVLDRQNLETGFGEILVLQEIMYRVANIIYCEMELQFARVHQFFHELFPITFIRIFFLISCFFSI